MRRTISGAAVAVIASATLLAGCGGDDPATTDPAVEDPAVVEDTADPMATMEDMATMAPTAVPSVP